MEKIEEATRKRVAAFLPRALVKALNSYHCFTERHIKQEPKDFAEHHNACKVAIAHIQLLIKLAQWADLEKEIQQNENLSEVLAIARATVSEHKDTYDNDEDENELQ